MAASPSAVSMPRPFWPPSSSPASRCFLNAPVPIPARRLSERLKHKRTIPMQPIHLPTAGPRYWAALCIASIFGANMGDFFARNIGLGHVAGLPFLAVALAIVIIVERFDRLQHQWYYWTAIIIVRTAATNFADF